MSNGRFTRDQRYEVLNLLVGRKSIAMTTIPEQGDPTRAAGLTATKDWFADGRYVREEIAGEFGGAKHEKQTLLGYNATRDRYEYMTADNHDGVILLYVTSPGSSIDDGTLTLFADYAMPTEGARAASFVIICTTLVVEGPDRHVLGNAYRSAGQAERPFLEYVYARVQ